MNSENLHKRITPLCLIIMIALVIYSAFAEYILPPGVIVFANMPIVKLVLFGIVAFAAHYNPCLGVLVLLAVLATIQCFCFNGLHASVTEGMDNLGAISGDDNIIVHDNFPKAYTHHYVDRPDNDPYDDINPHDDFYPSFVNEIQPDSRSMRNNYVQTEGYDSRDAYDRSGHKL